MTRPPPETAGIDTTWDDVDLPPLNSFRGGRDTIDDEAFERPTRIPSVPPDEYVRQMFAQEATAALAPQKTGYSDGLGSLREPDSDPAPSGLELAEPELEAVRSSTRQRLEEPTARPRRAAASRTGIEVDDLSLEPSLEPASPFEFKLGAGAAAQAPLPSPPPSAPPTPVADMKDRYAMGDFSGALVIAEGILESSPDDPDARRYAESCREVLTQMYSARLGALDQVVTVAVAPDQIRWLSLDHRAGFLLSLVDGISSIEELLDISGMARLDALRLMFMLLEQRVVALSPR